MGSWRRQKGESRHQGFQGTRSQNRKPPPCNWQPTVPAWEKKFCSVVGSVPWHKILEAKKFMCLYKNIVEWDDSAGEDAFWNAKNRFWAEINQLPCDISLPDPDEYIDKVNWDSALDNELLLDLDREPEFIPENDGSGGKIIFGNALLDQSFSCTGWGDCDDNFAKDPKVDQWDNDGWCKNSWEDNHNTVGNDRGWGGDWDDRLAQNLKVDEYHNNSWFKDPWEEDLDAADKDQGDGALKVTAARVGTSWAMETSMSLAMTTGTRAREGSRVVSGMAITGAAITETNSTKRGLKSNGTFTSALRT